MNDEKRDESRNLSADGEVSGSYGDSSGDDSQASETQESRPGSRRGTPGEANPALAETEGYKEGTVSTADFLRARGSAEAKLPDALEHRDQGFTTRAPHHGHPSPPVQGVTSESHLYDSKERHIMHEEPEMHVFAPGMLNISSDEKKARKAKKKRKEEK